MLMRKRTDSRRLDAYLALARIVNGETRLAVRLPTWCRAIVMATSLFESCIRQILEMTTSNQRSVAESPRRIRIAIRTAYYALLS